jgi:hypothetical protein
LTHVETERLSYLIKTEGLSFADAKVQARNELLNTFSMSDVGSTPSEHLDILEEGDGDAALIAISMIFQATAKNSTSKLAEVLTRFKFDLKEDGTIGYELMAELKNGAVLAYYYDTESILKTHFNLTKVANFKKYLDQFCNCADKRMVIPISNEYGKNLLYLPDKSILKKDSLYCISITLGKDVQISQFKIFLTRDATVSWNYGVLDYVNSTSHTNFNGWFYGVYYGEFFGELARQGSRATIPFKFTGQGKVKMSLTASLVFPQVYYGQGSPQVYYGQDKDFIIE